MVFGNTSITGKEAKDDEGRFIIVGRAPAAAKTGRMNSISDLAKQVGYGLASDPSFGNIARDYADEHWPPVGRFAPGTGDQRGRERRRRAHRVSFTLAVNPSSMSASTSDEVTPQAVPEAPPIDNIEFADFNDFSARLTSQRRQKKRKQRSAWGPALVTSIIAIAFLMTIAAIVLKYAIQPPVSEKPKDSKSKGTVSQTEQSHDPELPRPESDHPLTPPQPQHEIEVEPAPQAVAISEPLQPIRKWPQPTPEEIERAKSEIDLAGYSSAEAILRDADDCRDPSKGYALHVLAMDAAIAEKNQLIAPCSFDHVIDRYDVGLAERKVFEEKLRLAINVPVPANPAVLGNQQPADAPPDADQGRVFDDELLILQHQFLVFPQGAGV
jgi:hypothetical protein